VNGDNDAIFHHPLTGKEPNAKVLGGSGQDPARGQIRGQ
jgi:hypothetical protein